MKNATRAYHYDLDQGCEKYCIDEEIVTLIRCVTNLYFNHDYTEKCRTHINSNQIGKHSHHNTYAVTLGNHSHYEYNAPDLNRETCCIDETNAALIRCVAKLHLNHDFTEKNGVHIILNQIGKHSH